MKLPDSIAKAATEAVRAYSEISGIAQANEVPEIFLGSFIARSLHEMHGISAQVERKYLSMARDMGVEIDSALIDLMGGHAADVVLYEGKKPFAIIEIKKYDEKGNDSLVCRDLEKMRDLSSRVCGRLQTLVAVLITDTRSAKVEPRAAELARKLGGTFEGAGPIQTCGEGDTAWEWQVRCGSFDRSGAAESSLSMQPNQGASVG